MGVYYLSLITKTLDELWLVPVIFMASLPSYQKTYLLCTISLEYSTTVKKPKFPIILKIRQKSSVRPILHEALH